MPALPQLRTLTSYVARWTDELTALPTAAPIPPRLVRAGGVARPRLRRRRRPPTAPLIHGDLHYENVLAGDREPWLVIDPKPMSGDPHYEVAPMLWNRLARSCAGGVRDGVRRRFHTIVDAAGLDEPTGPGTGWCSGWSCNAMGGLDATECVAIAKAVQD